MWIVLRPGSWQTDAFEELTDPLSHGGAAFVPLGVQRDHFGDLVADALHRVQRVQRTLEDDRR